jgi:MauM/NapG family ferredoxin protein
MRSTLPRKPTRKSRRTSAWLLARRATQLLAFIAFLGIFLSLKQWGLRQPLSAVPFWLDPYAMLTLWLSGHQWLPWTLLCLVTVASTVIFGRAWCGWICPLGTLFDWLPARRPGVYSESHERMRKVKHILLLVSLTLAVFGVLIALLLDPLAILFRSLTTFIWPAMNFLITSIEKWIYPIDMFKGLVNGFEFSIRPLFLPPDMEAYRFPALFAILFIGLFLLNLFRERYWCRYLCPLGSGLGLISKIALVKRQVGEKCSACGICAQQCPTGTIDPQNGFRSDPAECTVCMRCLDDCPLKVTQFTFSPKPAGWQAYDPSRRDVFRTVGLSAAALFLLKLGASVPNDQKHAFRILPPGAEPGDLFSKCIRCSECIRVCPTGGLQPAITESGLTGLWTPVLVPRIGHCEYSCNACGQICPTRAIRPLSLEVKHATVIGCAAIDTSRCIAWGERQACIVCQEVCPLPEKAIILEDGLDINGRPLKLPRVVAQRCIGCGTCEKKCPVAGPAAIRVFTSRDVG